MLGEGLKEAKLRVVLGVVVKNEYRVKWLQTFCNNLYDHPYFQCTSICFLTSFISCLVIHSIFATQLHLNVEQVKCL